MATGYYRIASSALPIVRDSVGYAVIDKHGTDLCDGQLLYPPVAPFSLLTTSLLPIMVGQLVTRGPWPFSRLLAGKWLLP